MQIWVVLNDIHLPYQDKPVLDLVLNFIQELQPDGIDLNGDIVDCATISDYEKSPLSKASLLNEVKEADKLMQALSDVPTKRWRGGNHEDRLRRYVWRKAPALGVLPGLEFGQLFHCEDYGFKYTPYGSYDMLGKLLVTHGSLVSTHSARSGQAHWEKYGESVLIGHVHRLGIFYRTQRGKVHAAYENGCLCGLQPGYVIDPNWQQGFSVVTVDTGGFFHVEQIPILRQRGKPLFYYHGARCGG